MTDTDLVKFRKMSDQKLIDAHFDHDMCPHCRELAEHVLRERMAKKGTASLYDYLVNGRPY